VLQREDHAKPDTHPVPRGNYVIGLGNYLTADRSRLGNFLIVHTQPAGRPQATGAVSRGGLCQSTASVSGRTQVGYLLAEN
jgi:hypothetical protein